MHRHLLLCLLLTVTLALLLGCSSTAVEPPVEAPAPQQLDPATIKRAEEAAEAYLKAHPYAGHVPESPEQQQAEHAFDDIDAAIRDATIYLDEKNVIKASDCFLAASRGFTSLTATTKHFAPEHYHASLRTLSELARRLLADTPVQPPGLQAPAPSTVK